ncbi:chaperone modulator CbpM [Micromonospora sp. WMMD718]|uniref:chaperone modulator CbpM n=1 Tax=Micromonospora TaxID=1873 RepID=UPI00069EDF33|nr:MULTISPECIES: chaperone modulator CbpM [unclassified Micromonospora]MDG4751599.1 chaperone modulator CbpM [Micromonospora sp. WMMD718]
MRHYPITHVSRADGAWPLPQFATAAGMDTHMVLRLVRLGLLEAATDPTGQMWLPAAQLTRAAAIVRLRAGLGLNYTALGLVLDLLARIDHLEQQLRAAGRAPRR